VHKVYDQARTPYQRLHDGGVPRLQSGRQELVALYQRLNPVALKKQLEDNQERLYALRERPCPTAPPKSVARTLK